MSLPRGWFPAKAAKADAAEASIKIGKHRRNTTIF
jgi:hypothetical protein